jgi:hypothetical protein
MMRKINNLQILGAAITTIGIMFLIIFALSYLNLVPMSRVGVDTAIISLLMATNGYMIMLYGLVSKTLAAAAIGMLN